MYGVALLLLCLILALAVLMVMAMRRVFEARRRREREAVEEKRCACGYSLRGLTLPRCPECGRALGFDKTFEELGIRPEELRDRKTRP